MILNAACGGTLDATDPFGTVAAVRTLARAAVLALTCAGLGACAGERPQSTVSPGLDSGVTSSNGGGTRALGNQPNVGVTTRVR